MYICQILYLCPLNMSSVFYIHYVLIKELPSLSLFYILKRKNRYGKFHIGSFLYLKIIQKAGMPRQRQKLLQKANQKHYLLNPFYFYIFPYCHRPIKKKLPKVVHKIKSPPIFGNHFLLFKERILSDFFFNLCSFTNSIFNVVKLTSANSTMTDELNAIYIR